MVTAEASRRVKNENEHRWLWISADLAGGRRGDPSVASCEERNAYFQTRNENETIDILCDFVCGFDCRSVNIVGVTALPDLAKPTVIPVHRAPTANQEQMELPVETALPEQQVLTARLALKGPKAIRVEPETANLFAQ
jgi:hypothetical protein